METKFGIKIAVVGAESTGKTALCVALAKHFHAALVPEYARTYFQKADINHYQINDLEIIAKKQIELENEQLNLRNALLICDTNLITIKIWAELEFNACPNSILALKKQNKYDFYLITSNDLPWEKDPLRQNKFNRDLIFDLNLEEVKAENCPYAIVSGYNAGRIQNAIQSLCAFLKNKTKN